MNRNHRIHQDDGTGKPLCGVKKWQCLNDSNKEIVDIECKFCLRIMDKNKVTKGRKEE